MRVPATLLLTLWSAPGVFAQGGSLPPRETLSYTVEWRLITAGRARIDWSAKPSAHAGWEIKLHLESTGLVSKLFRVSDDYTAQLNPGLCVETALFKAQEGSRRRETRITYEKGKASYLERDTAKNTTVLAKEIDVPPCVHDVTGGLYFLRTLNLEPGQSVQIPVSDGKKSVMARVEAQQRETIKTPAGTFKTIGYEVYLFNGVLYQRKARLNVWLSDDRERLPVQIRVRMQFAIGTITLQLEKHE